MCMRDHHSGMSLPEMSLLYDQATRPCPAYSHVIARMLYLRTLMTSNPGNKMCALMPVCAVLPWRNHFFAKGANASLSIKDARESLYFLSLDEMVFGSEQKSRTLMCVCVRAALYQSPCHSSGRLTSVIHWCAQELVCSVAGCKGLVTRAKN